MEGISADVERLGARVQPSWLSACAAHLQASVPGFSSVPPQQKAKLVLQQLLHSDLNKCGVATLPPGVQVRAWRVVYTIGDALVWGFRCATVVGQHAAQPTSLRAATCRCLLPPPLLFNCAAGLARCHAARQAALASGRGGKHWRCRAGAIQWQ